MEDEELPPKRRNRQRKSNTLQIYGNEKTMNLNSMILTNVHNSVYFKNVLAQLTTYHEVVDEIYYHVAHLEPWEKGSRKLAGQVGMCGGVRGVGAGGIISSAFCLLYKLFTLRLTRKQLTSVLNHKDSPFIRGVGFLYVRYALPPADLWDWFEPYLDDEEEVDPKAGGGNKMTIGVMCQEILGKLEWYGTLFPRIPVPVQKSIEEKLRQHRRAAYTATTGEEEEEEREIPPQRRSPSPSHVRRRSPSYGRDVDRDRREKERRRRRSRSRERRRSRSRERRRSRSRSKDRRRRSRSRSKESRRRRRSRSRSPDRGRRRRRSRSRERRRRSRSRDGERRS
ncbi:pre-mRNA-splicing factor 38B-like [Oscarella lobularis]|uniref:pre-mRNA-splicing factor 38B-like n=1 Tax=Oscarella lobularis TaxID=121494 RepID=UPI003313C4A7